MDAAQRVLLTLARILARKYPGTSWAPADGSGDASRGSVVVQLASPDDLDAIQERRMRRGGPSRHDRIDAGMQ